MIDKQLVKDQQQQLLIEEIVKQVLVALSSSTPTPTPTPTPTIRTPTIRTPTIRTPTIRTPTPTIRTPTPTIRTPTPTIRTPTPTIRTPTIRTPTPTIRTPTPIPLDDVPVYNCSKNNCSKNNCSFLFKKQVPTTTTQLVDQWVEECCNVGPNYYFVAANERAFKYFSLWCRNKNIAVPFCSSFSNFLGKKYRRYTSTNEKLFIYLGIDLKKNLHLMHNTLCFRKLNEAQVLEIKKQLKLEKPLVDLKKLARDFGVSVALIKSIKNNKCWKDIVIS